MITKPTIKELQNKLKADLVAKFPTLNITKLKTFSSALTYALAARFRDVYNVFDDIVKQSFLTTATGENLKKGAAEYGITQKAATQAVGFINFTGDEAKLVPTGTKLKSADGLYYTTRSIAEITREEHGAVNCDIDNGVVTLTFSFNHELSENVPLTVISANVNPSLVGTYDITLVSATQVSFTISDIGLSGADSLLVEFTRGLVGVISTEYGENQNKGINEILTLEQPLANINKDAGITFAEIGGGADIEDLESLRFRALQKKQNPSTNFNIAAIQELMLQLSWVSKVFVLPATPIRGNATIYLLKQNNETPSPQEILLAQAHLEPEIPVSTVISDYPFESVKTNSVDFTFSSITPNTETIKAVVKNNLNALFEEKASLGQGITYSEYTRTILNSVNPENTGEIVESYTLDSPTGDIEAASDEILVLGEVTWN